MPVEPPKYGGVSRRDPREMGASCLRKPSGKGCRGVESSGGSQGRVLGRDGSGERRLWRCPHGPALVHLLDGRSEPPTAAIPQACGTWAHTKAAYRFFDNPRVTPDAIMAPQRQQTVRRSIR